MTRKLFLLIPVICLAGSASAQTVNTASLAGLYHFVQLEVASQGGIINPARNLSGTLTFDGQGSYSFSGEETAGLAGAVPLEGEGAYEVSPLGEVRLANPLHKEFEINGKLGAEGSVLVGTSTDGASETWDLFVAMRTGEDVANDTLKGDYTLAALSFPGANPSQYRSGVASLLNVGDGRIESGEIVSRSRGGPLRTEDLDQSSYVLNGGGSGTVSFEGGAELLSGDYKIYVTADGSFLLGHSSGASRDIVIGIRNNQGAALNFQGRYWIAELNVEAGRFSSACGALLPHNTAITRLAERVHLEPNTVDFTGLNFFEVLDSSGRGWLANRFLDGTVANMSLGATDANGNARALVGAEFAPFDQPGAADQSEEEFGIFLAVQAPDLRAEGLSVHPAGVVNGASFALQPNPIAPGAIVSIFGTGFTSPDSQESAVELPLPTELLGVSITISGIQAPMYFVSENQINVQVPFGLAGDESSIVVHRGGNASDSVEVRLAPTSPGVFSFASTESFFSGIVTHADGELVTANNPAFPGETVVIYATGLGKTEPPVETGRGNPSDPLAWVADPDIGVFFSLRPAAVLFAGGTPGFAGLYQINATISDDTPTGLNVPLAIQTTNAFHDQVDIPIAGIGALKQANEVKRMTTERPLPPRARR